MLVISAACGYSMWLSAVAIVICFITLFAMAKRMPAVLKNELAARFSV